MIVSIPLHLSDLSGTVRVSDIEACLHAYYDGASQVSVAAADLPRLDAASLADRDDMELRVHGNEARRQVLLTARLDNLGKGAAGAALQNIRLMCALEA